MQALTTPRYGTPDVLELTELPTPDVGPNDVLIDIKAADVTRGDLRVRAANYPAGWTWLAGRLAMGVFKPNHPVGGTMFAGRVSAVGAEVTRFSVGDDVFGTAMHGAWAEQIVLAEDDAIAIMPRGLTYDEAAALPYGGLVAWLNLNDLAALQTGERALIVGAAGGIGRAAVQIAKHLGAEVTAVCSADDSELVEALGADHVIDYRATDVTTTGERFDVVLDTSGTATFGAYRAILTDNGRFTSAEVSLGLIGRMLFNGLRKGPKAYFGVSIGTAEGMEQLREVVEAGGLRAVIGQRFSLADAAAAHRHAEGERPSCSVVLTMPSTVAVRLAA